MNDSILGAELRAALEEWRRLLTSQQAACAAGDYAQVLGLATEADWLVVRIGDVMTRLHALPDGAAAALDACRIDGLALRDHLDTTTAAAIAIRDGIVRQIRDLAEERQRVLAIGYGRPTVKELSVLNATG